MHPNNLSFTLTCALPLIDMTGNDSHKKLLQPMPTPIQCFYILWGVVTGSTLQEEGEIIGTYSLFSGHRGVTVKGIGTREMGCFGS
jgi:hypothetical protein